MIKLNTPFRIVLDILILAVIAFIWINSTLPVSDSNALSHGFMDKLLDFFWLDYDDLPIDKEAFHGVIRKLAHAFEFACLGGLFCLRLGKNSAKIAVFTAWGLTVCVAVLDEFIQSFSDRACRFSDMCIDSCGAAAGIGFVLLVIYVIKKVRTRHMS